MIRNPKDHRCRESRTNRNQVIGHWRRCRRSNLLHDRRMALPPPATPWTGCAVVGKRCGISGQACLMKKKNPPLSAGLAWNYIAAVSELCWNWLRGQDLNLSPESAAQSLLKASFAQTGNGKLIPARLPPIANNGTGWECRSSRHKRARRLARCQAPSSVSCRPHHASSRCEPSFLVWQVLPVVCGGRRAMAP